ncbi:MAG: 2-C-methyl-D-erythritol 2,4-cyclodiphosphate synthase [Gemmatimonas sp.]
MPEQRELTHRVGIGYDSHRLAPGGPLRLGGVDIPAAMHCVAHSDGDAVCHAVTDAILGGAGLGDIGEMFPDTDDANRGRDSIEMLEAALRRISDDGWSVGNVDITVITERPKIGAHRVAIRASLATALRIREDHVGIKGKTNEGLGFIGREEGLGVIAVVSLVRHE